jgi:predicted nicotinamide N-methyase
VQALRRVLRARADTFCRRFCGGVVSSRRELEGAAAVELGAGTGVAGVALALLGARVLLTDQARAQRASAQRTACRRVALSLSLLALHRHAQEAALPLLRRNLAAARAAAARAGAPALRVAAAPLPWGGDVDASVAAALAAAPEELRLALPVDVLLGSDVVYDVALVPPLLATLRALAGPASRALLAVDAARAPLALAALLAAAAAHGWRARRVPEAHLHPLVRHPDIQLLLLTRRRDNADDGNDDDDDSGDAAEVRPVEEPAADGAAAPLGVDADAWRARRQGAAAARLLAAMMPHSRETG